MPTPQDLYRAAERADAQGKLRVASNLRRQALGIQDRLRAELRAETCRAAKAEGLSVREYRIKNDPVWAGLPGPNDD